MPTKKPKFEQTVEQRNATGMLVALGALKKHLYEGTVPAHVVARRRAKNKVARASRRLNRAA